MKLLSALLLAAAPVLLCQELHKSGINPQGNRVDLAADRIEREAPSVSWQLAVVHLKGHVVVRIPFAQFGGEPSKTQYVIIHAEEADYHEDSGQIEPRGNVRVDFEAPKTK